MLNKVELIGRLGAEPKIATTTAGAKVASLSVGVSETWKDKASGEKKERTEWTKVVLFKSVEYAEKYAHKGDLVYVCGKMQTRSYDKDGRTIYVTEVVLNGFDSKFEILKSSNPKTAEPEQPQEVYNDDLNDDIPFN